MDHVSLDVVLNMEKQGMLVGVGLRREECASRMSVEELIAITLRDIVEYHSKEQSTAKGKRIRPTNTDGDVVCDKRRRY